MRKRTTIAVGTAAIVALAGLLTGIALSLHTQPTSSVDHGDYEDAAITASEESASALLPECPSRGDADCIFHAEEHAPYVGLTTVDINGHHYVLYDVTVGGSR